jgi:hypothetical protein
MKIDFSYLMSDKFKLCDNNILYTIESILAEKSKFSIFGRFPNEDGEGFYLIEQVQVLNAVFDVEADAVCQPRIRKWDAEEEEMGEKFEKKISVLYILTHPVLKGMRSPRIFYTVDIRLKGFVDYEKFLYVQNAAAEREELVPGYGGFAIPDDYRKYLSPMLLTIYREILIAKNNSLNNAAALLTGRFFEIFLSEQYGTAPGTGIEHSVEAIKDQKLKSVLDFALKKGNEFIKCVTGKKSSGITDDDVERMADFLHIFIENYINPRKTADLEKQTGMVLQGLKD